MRKKRRRLDSRRLSSKPKLKPKSLPFKNLRKKRNYLRLRKRDESNKLS